jgi:hypothetical protein
MLKRSDIVANEEKLRSYYQGLEQLSLLKDVILMIRLTMSAGH